MWQVLFVDFGYEEWVSEHNLREIEKRFLHLPLQAVECGLDGLTFDSLSACVWPESAR